MRTSTAAVMLALLGGCAMVGPNFQRPAVELPGSYGEREAGATQAVPANWWTLYRDPALDRLMDAGFRNNSDLRIAVARIEEAEALLREANAVLVPEVDLSAAGARTRASTRTGTLPASVAPIRNNFALTANTSFELDFWGRLRRAAEAARAQYLASRYGQDVVTLTLSSAIAQTYFGLRSLDAQVLVSQESLKSAEETLDLARRRFNAGLISELDVNQAAASRAQLAAQVSELRRQRQATLHQLGVLTGQLDLKLDAGDVRAVPTPPLPPAGLPSALLERRPDVRQAEAQFASATALIGVSRAAQFPTFSLTAAVGRQSRELDTLFGAGGGIWSIGLNALGPIFDAGRYAARTEQAEARARQSAAAYEKAVRGAFREVSDALSNVEHAAAADTDLTERVAQARNSLKLATLRYESGYSAYLEVLDAQRTLNDAQLAQLRNRQSFLGYTVDLMNALGGGWTP